MSRKRNKKYVPPQRYNLEVLNRRIEKLDSDIQHHKDLLDAVNKANNLHVEQLSNFVRHDLKNAILGLNGILFNARTEKSIPEPIQKELDTAFSMIEASLDNFTDLIPSTTELFTYLPKILNAVELLSRSALKSNHTQVRFEYDRQSTQKIYYPFQSLVQVIHNLVINAHNALCDIPDKKILIKGDIAEGICNIRVYDNARMIENDQRDKIFNYGYSTTGGTGIGLFHAKQVVNEMRGSIDFVESDLPEYTKYFIVTINTSVTNE